ncbi:hypothetical protein FGB62_30g110 [Gracilaria domingensis]|nr:hypothetical protein FGB62_30g110 [Gracilaria domingensis]
MDSEWTESDIHRMNIAVNQIELDTGGKDLSNEPYTIPHPCIATNDGTEQHQDISVPTNESYQAIPAFGFDLQTIIQMNTAMRELNQKKQELQADEDFVDETVYLSSNDVIFSYQTLLQSRPGTKHGKGGRRHAAGAAEQRAKIPESLKTMVWKFLSHALGGIEKAIHRIFEGLRFRSLAVPLSPGWENNLKTYLGQLLRNVDRVAASMFQLVPNCPVLCLCTRTQFSQVGIDECNAMERHVACTWISLDGVVLCTCIGLTQFRILGTDGQPEENQCLHVKGLYGFLQGIASTCGIRPLDVGQLLAEMYKTIFGSHHETYMSRSNAHILFNNRICVLSSVSKVSVKDVLCMIPVRCMRHGQYICAFCDTAYHGGCEHTRGVQAELQARSDDSESTLKVESMGEEEGVFGTPFYTKSLSYLPLPPVSCSKAIQVDLNACNLASMGKPFQIHAPTHCQKCGSRRQESSQKLWKDGVLMCTREPCALHVEEYVCSNQTCNSPIQPEGREQFVLLLNMCTAGTHALLRQELIGVVLGNGTLNSRLKHFHSQVQANVNAGYFGSSTVPCRSVRTIQDMCILMIKLMTMEPDVALFRCDTCEDSSETIPIICIDGIQLGNVSHFRGQWPGPKGAHIDH